MNLFKATLILATFFLFSCEEKSSLQPIDKNNTTLEPGWTHWIKENSTLPNNAVSYMLETSNGELLVASGREIYKFKNEKFLKYCDCEDSEIKTITQIFEYEGQILYVSTNGIYFLDNKSSTRYGFGDNKADYIYSGIVVGQYLWYGSLGGLYKMNLETKEIEKIDNPLFDNVSVRSILKINDGKFLIGTQGSGYCFIMVNLQFMMKVYRSLVLLFIVYLKIQKAIFGWEGI